MIGLRPLLADFNEARAVIFSSRHLGVRQDPFLEYLWNRSLEKTARVLYSVAKLGALGLRYPVPQTECARAALKNHSIVFHA